MRYDMVKEAYKLERDLKRETGLDLTDPQLAEKLLQKGEDAIRGGEFDREYEEGAEFLRDMGADTNADEIKAFDLDVIDTIQKLSDKNKDPLLKEGEMALHDAEHMAEDEIKRDIQAIEAQA